MLDQGEKDELAVELGSSLRRLRLDRGLNLEELSRLSGVGISTLSHVENGNRDPKLSTISRLLKALRADLNDLLGSAPVPLERDFGGVVGYDLDL